MAEARFTQCWKIAVPQYKTRTWRFSSNHTHRHGILQSERGFKIDVMKTFNQVKENLERQFSELRNKINEQNKQFPNEVEIIKEPSKTSAAEELSRGAEARIGDSAGDRADRMGGRTAICTEGATRDSGERRETDFVKSEESRQELSDSIRVRHINNGCIRRTREREGEERLKNCWELPKPAGRTRQPSPGSWQNTLLPQHKRTFSTQSSEMIESQL